MSLKQRIKNWLQLEPKDIQSIKKETSLSGLFGFTFSSMFSSYSDSLEGNIKEIKSDIDSLSNKIDKLQKNEAYLEKYLNIKFIEDKTEGYQKVKKEKKKKVVKCCCDSYEDYED